MRLSGAAPRGSRGTGGPHVYLPCQLRVHTHGLGEPTLAGQLGKRPSPRQHHSLLLGDTANSRSQAGLGFHRSTSAKCPRSRHTSCPDLPLTTTAALVSPPDHSCRQDPDMCSVRCLTVCHSQDEVSKEGRRLLTAFRHAGVKQEVLRGTTVNQVGAAARGPSPGAKPDPRAQSKNWETSRPITA